MHRILGNRVSPSDRTQKLKIKVFEHTDKETPETSEKIEKYLLAIKQSLTNEDNNESDRLAYAEALLKCDTYTKADQDQIKILESKIVKEESVNITVDDKNSEEGSNGGGEVVSREHPPVLFSSIKKQNLVAHLMFSLHVLPFECKKTTSTIISCLFHKNPNNENWEHQVRDKIIQYFEDEPTIIGHLLNYYSESAEFADCLNAGEILRELCKIPQLATIIRNNHWERFFELANLSGFDKLADALQVFNDILTRHKTQASKFLAENHEVFLKRFNEELIGSECNFVTKKQCIKLLAQILSNKENYRVMLSYVQGADNLKVIMKLLQDSASSIQLEAFHVFKIFVANPQVQKIEKVARILYRNKEQLIDFLKKFQNGQNPDEVDPSYIEFENEKNYLIKTISEIQNPTRTPNAGNGNAGTSTSTRQGSIIAQQGSGEPAQPGGVSSKQQASERGEQS